MSGPVYLLDDDRLVEMSEKPYDAEDVLQRLIEQHPRLLAGEQVDVDRPRRWLLVAREMGVPDSPGASDRWALDHLFLDQDGVPTLVEVKRSSDTRVRREVVGQMLDYAANAVAYWPMESVRAQVEASAERDGVDPADLLFQALEVDNPEDFWERVKTNLQAGKVRLLFVADRIPPELRRIVEFLNDQMTQAEVLALEVRQFTGEGRTTLVPSVIGQTARAIEVKGSGSAKTRQWDEPTFMAELRSSRGDADAAVAKRLLEWAKSNGMRIWWGRGQKMASFVPILDVGQVRHFFFSVWTYGTVQVQFQLMQGRQPFSSDELRGELLQRLNRVPGLAWKDDVLAKLPNAPLSVLGTEEAAEAFLRAFDWCLAQIRR